ncbi:MAG: carboxylesterase family protein [Armatimonadota bacterium]
MRLLPLIVLLFVAPFALAQDKVEALRRDVEQLQSAAPTPAIERNLPLAQLAVKKARLLSTGQFWGAPDNFRELMLKQGEQAVARAKAGEAPPLTPGKLNELAYVTANDGTVQPYYLYVPPDYAPEKKWPLIVFLHGYVPSISVLEPWIPSEEQCDVAGTHGAMLLVPYGRRNTDFQGIGEVDVLASMAEVCRWYPVDQDRVYLSGVSMGGMGAWNIALRHPGMFAAVTPMCGQTDMFRWWKWDREQTEPWKRWLIDWDNALEQVPNLRNQHVFVQHGLQDNLIPVEQTKLMAEAAEQAGTPIKTYYFPDEGHFIYFRTDSYDNAWSWQKQFKLERSPKRVDFKTWSLEYDRAYWLRVSRLEEWGKPGMISAEVNADGTALKITSTNIREIAVDVKAAGLAEAFTCKWNDGPAISSRLQPDGTVIILRGSLLPPPPSSMVPVVKRRGLTGPCEDVFNTRFLLVQGTQGAEEQKTDLARKVAQWCKDWDDFGDGVPPVKLDSEISEQDIKDCNLVLFGTPETNSVLSKVAGRLPIRIADHRYEMAGNVYEGADLGLVMCYPNPLNPARYVLIYAGEAWGEKLSVNHKHDLLPDFCIFTTKSFGRDDTNDVLCAGFFDVNWQLSLATTWTPQRP